MKENQSILFYLAAPYSHPDSSVRQMRHMTVNRIAFQLHQQGKFVYSPLTHNIPLIQTCNRIASWDDWGQFDQLMLSRCDKLLVVTMDGWEASRGVFAEMQLAKELAIPIEMLDPIRNNNQ